MVVLNQDIAKLGNADLPQLFRLIQIHTELNDYSKKSNGNSSNTDIIEYELSDEELDKMFENAKDKIDEDEE
jgi:hypothetical protein